MGMGNNVSSLDQFQANSAHGTFVFISIVNFFPKMGVSPLPGMGYCQYPFLCIKCPVRILGIKFIRLFDKRNQFLIGEQMDGIQIFQV